MRFGYMENDVPRMVKTPWFTEELPFAEAEDGIQGRRPMAYRRKRIRTKLLEGNSMNIPEKCQTCEHTIMAFENVHKGWCRFQIEEVVRCDCAPHHPIVGCCDAEVTCRRKTKREVTT